MDANMNMNPNMNTNINTNMNPAVNPKPRSNFAGPLIIGLAIVISCAILGGAFLKYKTSDVRTISATGSASVDFDADLIVWRGYFTAYSERC